MATPVEPKPEPENNNLHSRTGDQGAIDPVRVSAEAPAPHHPLEMAICMGMDAMRLCLGMPTRNYTRDEIEAWMDAMAETETKP
jgi:hypothetical protein